MADHKLLTILAFFLSSSLFAQQKDAGLWTSVNFKGEFSKKLQWSIAPEVRLRDNMTNVGSVFSDLGLDVDLPKKFSLTLTYRFGQRNEIDFFETRQRLQLGLGYKISYNDWTINLATRYQGNLQGVGNDRDADFVTTWRNKIAVKYEGFDKWELGTSYEFFHAYDDGVALKWNDWRWTANAERKINKRNFYSVGYLIQRDLVSNEPNTDFVVLVSYKHVFKKKKKDSESVDTLEK
jgi:hypothetical protein